MSDQVYQALARARSGFVEAPAGCGKTEAIVRAVGYFCDDCQLVLTHTHAGVDALRQRFRRHRVPRAKYHVDTIAGWAWSWVRMYPANAGYRGSLEMPDWAGVYAAMCELIAKSFVRSGILNSYRGVIVDEYQDCTDPMHQLIVELRRLLPCRVLGDDLQGVFGFRDDALVKWADVAAAFGASLGTLETPYRWIDAGNEPLGRWLLDSRPVFRDEREPDYRGSPVMRIPIAPADFSRRLVSAIYEKDGRICVIGPKARPLPSAIETTLVNHRFRIVEPNDLSTLRDLIQALSDGTTAKKVDAVLVFFERVFGGFSEDERNFFAAILRGKRARIRRADRKLLCRNHRDGTTPALLHDLLVYAEGRSEMPCKLKDSASALKCVLEEHLATRADLKSLYATEIARRQYQNRSRVYRCIGSTLLLKGLEFDHAIVVRGPNWQRSWGSHKDLYVALTRGSNSTTLIDIVA